MLNDMDDSFERRVLNRSLSSPDIFTSPTSVHRRVYVQEVIRLPNLEAPMIRHFSYEEIYNGRNEKPPKTYNDLTPINPRRTVHKNDFTDTTITSSHDMFHDSLKALTISDSAMEVDPIDNTIHNSQYTHVDTANQMNQQKRKRKRARRLVPKQENNPTTTSSSIKYIGSKKSSCVNILCVLKVLFLIFCTLSITLIYFDNPLIFVNRDAQLQNLKNDLEQQVLSQSDPVMMVTRSLEKMAFWSQKMKVLPFVGSSGVGKTHITNIIKKNFHSKLVHEISKEVLWSPNAQSDFRSRLRSCCCNLLIVDDLTAADVNRFLDFIHVIPKSIFVLAIPIFSVQHMKQNLEYYIDYNDFRKIELAFDKSGFFHEVVVFEEIDDKTAHTWLTQKIRDEKGADGQYEELVKDILSNHDLKFKGFKGLHTKIYI